MSFLMSIVPALIVLGLLITIHEFGHFIACRLTGVKVDKFSIGFGPEIVHFQGPETRYAISVFPLGGFVKPAGESIGEVEDQGGPKPGDYLAAPLLSRIFIVCAGVLMNYFLAFVLFAAVFMMGRPVPGTTIGQFVEGYPAEASGLQKSDRIIQVEDKEVRTWTDLTETLSQTSLNNLKLLVVRNDRQLWVEIQPKVESVKNIFGEEVEVRRIGIMPHPEAQEFEKYGFVGALGRAWDTSVQLTVMTHKAIFYLITGRLSMKTMAGPIGIISMTGTAAQLGLPYVMQLAAMLSISLAVINLLPIPALDGGHLFFLLIEAVRRKSVSLQFQEKATQVGFMLLLTLMVFIIYNDLVNLEAFEKFKSLFGS